MNNAIVICYTGAGIGSDEAYAIQQLIANHCNADIESITVKAFDSDSIAKTLLKEVANDTKISFLEGGESAETTAKKILEEARTKAIQLIKSKYSEAAGHISLTRDIVMARYHHRVNAIDDDERTLLDAIDVIVDIPQKRLNTLLPKAIREVIFTIRDL